MNFSSTERDAYEDHFKWLRIEANTLKKAEAKGVEKGKKEGREEGKKEGANIKTQEIAKLMLSDGDSPIKISKITGLSISEIKEMGLKE